MLDLTQRKRSKAQHSAAMWRASTYGFAALSVAAFTAAMFVSVHAQRAPDPPMTLQPLPQRPTQVAVNLTSDPFEPLVTTSLTIHQRNSQFASTNPYGIPGQTQNAVAVVRLCTTFLDDPRSAILQLDSTWITVDLTTHNRLGSHRIIAIGANAVELDNGTIIEQADCAGSATPAPTSAGQPQSASGPIINTPGDYQPNSNGILVPGPSVTPAQMNVNPYDQGPDNLNNKQQNNPYNDLYGQTPPPADVFPPLVRNQPGAPGNR